LILDFGLRGSCAHYLHFQQSKIENPKSKIELTVVGETFIMLALSAKQVGLRGVC